MKLVVCTMQRFAPNPHSCGHGGGMEIAQQLEKEVSGEGLHVPVERVACLGMCLKGPNVQLLPEGKNWHLVSLRNVSEIVAHIQRCYNKTERE